ncbi:hypothetical protein PRIC2_013836 [Phytophthora ramorum]
MNEMARAETATRRTIPTAPAASSVATGSTNAARGTGEPPACGGTSGDHGRQNNSDGGTDDTTAVIPRGQRRWQQLERLGQLRQQRQWWFESWPSAVTRGRRH